MADTAVVNFRESFSNNTGKVSLGRQARTSIGSGTTPDSTKRKLHFNGARSLFEGKPFYLDIRSSRYVKQIRADVQQLGGRIEDFLSKDVYCVVTDNADFKRGKGMQDGQDVSDKDSSPTTDGTAPACMTRGKAMLMKAATKDRLTSAVDVLKNAQSWGVTIKHLGEITALIKREKAQGFGKTSPQVQSKYNGDCIGNSRRKSQPPVKVKTFKTPYIKIEDTSQCFRPDHKQFDIFPSVDTSVPDYALDSPFVDSVRQPRGLPASATPCRNTGHLATEPKAESKPSGINDKPITGTLDSCKNQANTVKKVGKNAKKGYCECCCSWYSALHEHLNSEKHQKFAMNDENFKSLDELISSFPGIPSIIQLGRAKADNKSHHNVLTDVTNISPSRGSEGDKCSNFFSPKLVTPTDCVIRDNACSEPSKFCGGGQESFDLPPQIDGPYYEHSEGMQHMDKLGDNAREPLLLSNENCPLLVSGSPQDVVSATAVNLGNECTKLSACVAKSCLSQTTDFTDICVDSVRTDTSSNKGDNNRNVALDPPFVLARISAPSVPECQTSGQGQLSGQVTPFVPSCPLYALMFSPADSDHEMPDIEMHDVDDDVFIGHNDVTPKTGKNRGHDVCDGAKYFFGVKTCHISTPKDDSLRFSTDSNLVKESDLDITQGITKAVSDTPAETVLDTPTKTVLDTPLETVLDTEMVLGTPAETVVDMPCDTTVLVMPAENVSDTPTEIVLDKHVEMVVNTPVETMVDTPAETVLDTPSVKAVLGKPAEDVLVAPSEIILCTPPEMFSVTPVETVSDPDAPTKIVLDAPVETVLDTLAKTVLDKSCYTTELDTPAENVSDTSTETVLDTAPEMVLDVPTETVLDMLAKTVLDKSCYTTVLDTPAENVSDTSSEIVLDTAPEMVLDMPTETVLDTVAVTVLDKHAQKALYAPAKTVLDTPKTVLPTPAQTVFHTPTETVFDTPSKTVLDTPAENVLDTLCDTVLVKSKDNALDTSFCTVLGTRAESVLGTRTEPVNKHFEIVSAPTINALQVSVETVTGPEIWDTPMEIYLDTPTETVFETLSLRDMSFSDKSVLVGSHSDANSIDAVSLVTALAINAADESPSFDESLDEIMESFMNISTDITTPDDVNCTELNARGIDLSHMIATSCHDITGAIAEDTSLEMSAECSETLELSRVCDEDLDAGYSSDTIIVGELDERDMTMLNDAVLGCDVPHIELNTSFHKLVNISCFDEQSDETSQLDSTNRDKNAHADTATAITSGLASKSKYDAGGNFSELSSADSEDDFASFKDIKCSITGVIRSLEDNNCSASEELMPLDLSLKKHPSSSTDLCLRSSEHENSAHWSLGFARATGSRIVRAEFSGESPNDSGSPNNESSCPLKLVSRSSSDAIAEAVCGEMGGTESTGYPRRNPEGSSSGLNHVTVENIRKGLSKTTRENISNLNELIYMEDGFEKATMQAMLSEVPSAKTRKGHKNTTKHAVSELSQNVEYSTQKQMVDSMRQRIFGEFGAMPDAMHATAASAPPSHKCVGENCHVCSVYYQYQLMYMMKINQYYSYSSVTQFDPCANVPIPPTPNVLRASVTQKAREFRNIRKRNHSDSTDSVVTVSPWKVGGAGEKRPDEENCVPIVKPLKNSIHKIENHGNVTSRAPFAEDMNDCKSNAFNERWMGKDLRAQKVAFSVDEDMNVKSKCCELSVSAPEASSESRLLPDNDSFQEQPSKTKLPKTLSQMDSSSPVLPSAEDTLNSLYDGSTSAKLDSERCFGNIRECPLVSDVATDSMTSSPEMSELINHRNVQTPKGSVVSESSQWAVEHSGGLKFKFSRVVLTPLDVKQPDEESPQSEKAASRCTKRKRPSVCSKTGVQYCMSTKKRKKRKLQFE